MRVNTASGPKWDIRIPAASFTFSCVQLFQTECDNLSTFKCSRKAEVQLLQSCLASLLPSCATRARLSLTHQAKGSNALCITVIGAKLSPRIAMSLVICSLGLPIRKSALYRLRVGSRRIAPPPGADSVSRLAEHPVCPRPCETAVRSVSKPKILQGSLLVFTISLTCLLFVPFCAVLPMCWCPSRSMALLLFPPPCSPPRYPLSPLPP